MMYGREKSDSAIVAGKPTNKVVSATAEPVEPRAGAEGNANQQSTLRTQCRKCVSSAGQRPSPASPSTIGLRVCVTTPAKLLLQVDNLVTSLPARRSL
jgi:hypothetical protein